MSRLSEASTTRLDVRRLAVQATLLAGVAVETELRGDLHLPAKRSERFANEFLVCERAIDFGGIEERDAVSTAARITEIISCFSAAGP